METRSVTKQTAGGSHETLRFGSALLFCASLLGCVDSMSLGGAYEECTKNGTCSRDPVALDVAATGVSARASSKLTPVWSKSVSAQAMVKSAQGGVWLLSTRDSSLVLVKVSDAGEVGGEIVIAGLAPFPNTFSIGTVTGATFHPSGPVVTVEWAHYSPLEAKCSTVWGQSAASDPVQGKLCHDSTPQTFVFDEANLSVPALVDPCIRGSHANCHPRTVLRSGDGTSLLVVDNEWVKHETLASVVTSREKLPLELEAIVGVTSSADSWSLLASQYNEGWNTGAISGLATVRRDQPATAVRFLNVDSSSFGMGAGLLFTGPQPGQLIAVLESSASTVEAVATVERAGDLSVLRFEGEVLKSQQVFRREDYSTIRLLAAGADDVGNAFVVTATGNREADFAKTLTPLLCRAKVTGESACFELPATPSELQATRENVVFVRAGDVLSRFDIAP